MGKAKVSEVIAPVNLSKVTPLSRVRGANRRETIGLKKLVQEATDYLGTFDWCARIEETFLGIGIANILGVVLFRIRPSRKGVDSWIWVIVGDLPPAYITTDAAPNPAAALDGYIGAMQEWVAAAKASKPVRGLIPVNVAPTPKNAKELAWRLKLLDRELLRNYSEDLRE